MDLSPLTVYLVWIGIMFVGLIAASAYRMGQSRSQRGAPVPAQTLVVDGVLAGDNGWVAGSGDEIPILREIFIVVSSAIAGHRLGQVSRLITPALYQSLMVEESQTHAAPVQIAISVEEMDVIARAPDTSYLAMHFKGMGTRPDGATVNVSGAWKFEHHAGAGALPQEQARQCSNCGAPLDASVSGVCPYCHQVLVGDTNGWLVAAISPDVDVHFAGPQPSIGLFPPEISGS